MTDRLNELSTYLNTIARYVNPDARWIIGIEENTPGIRFTDQQRVMFVSDAILYADDLVYQFSVLRYAFLVLAKEIRLSQRS